ncbi:hypothetical protein ABZ641_18975, partial [Kitasatospora sp. NPDC007106]
MTAGALLVVGEVVTDVVALHEGPLAPHTDTAARIAVRPGGAGANAAAWAAAGGARVRLLARPRRSGRRDDRGTGHRQGGLHRR